MTLQELIDDDRELIPVTEVQGSLLPIDKRTIYKGVDEGSIPGLRVGRKILIARTPLVNLLTGKNASLTGSQL